jgi:hypothetical protein
MSALFDETPEERAQIETARREAMRIAGPLPLLALRILWWLCFSPNQVDVIRKSLPKRVKHASRWLAITLVWLPLLISIIGGAAFGVPYTYLKSDVVTLILWTLVAWGIALFLARFDHPFTMVLAAALGFCISIWVLFGLLAGLVYSLVVGVVVIVTFGILDGVVDGVAIGVLFGVVFAALLNISINVPAGPFVALVFIVLMAVAYATALGVARGMDRAKKEGRATISSRAAFIVLMAAFAFLIWFSFLGGYRVFTSWMTANPVALFTATSPHL